MSKQVVMQIEEKMRKTIEHLKSELQTLKAGRATPAVLDGIKVKYYGTDVPVNQVASISIPESRLIVITPWEKSVLPDLEKAILKADIGITPQNDGRVIRLPIPQLTEERRKDIIKTAKKITEEHKVILRNERRDAIEVLKKDFNEKKITEDERFKSQDELQKLTDSNVKKIDEILLHKEKEIMEV
ncbi:MAG: ribosome recycling factor [Elusimicrobia bacterium]|nr:ribosome recycling factor [Elusimicrobiota bacterium]